MRLGEWLSRSPNRESTTAKVMAPATEALALLGADPDPECWISWGDDPGARYTILALAAAGLALVNVRVNVPGEGPRAAGKLVRWHRVSVGELSVEIQGGRRLITFQLESHLLHGSDDTADEISRFAIAVLAAIDGRAAPATGAIPLSGPAVEGASDAAHE